MNICGALKQVIYKMLIGYNIHRKVGILVNIPW